jgi:rfaE bifunctional protein kinase chain/domain
MTAEEILKSFPKLRALVVGDICLDRWCTYDPKTAEPSRETGIPRIGVVATKVTPGAGGTIANNLVALGVGTVAVLGVIGDDGFGLELVRALQTQGILADLLIQSRWVPTFTYTKLLNLETGAEDLPRVDFITTTPLPIQLDEQVCSRLETVAKDFDVILISDQAETDSGGIVTERMRQTLTRLAESHPGKILWVDSRLRAEHFRKVILKPNRDEGEAASMRQFGRIDFTALRQHTDSPLLVVTDGPGGVLLFEEGQETRVQTKPRENPVDICGAGDSFSAGASMALAVTHDPREASRFGNLVASITIMKKGTGTASPEEVLEAERELAR